MTSFFEESKEQSKVKTAIVTKYFWAWAKVIIATLKRHNSGQKIAYIDLFSGPGRYKDGTKSTPLLILEKAIADQDFSNMLVTIFNDVDENHSKSLEKAINELPGINRLKYPPVVYNNEVGTEATNLFQEMKFIPTLFFIDPWGYKGLSLKLINSVIKNWGCDCIFFFNYNRINMGVTNECIEKHIKALFGEKRTERIRKTVSDLSPKEREFVVINEFSMALKEMGAPYVLPFCFKDHKGVRTSHHLVFVSKDPKGYDIMKRIMAKQSSDITDGVASFDYCPASKQFSFLHLFTNKIDSLGEELLRHFAGETLTMSDIYKKHNVDTPFIDTNYKEALKILEQEGKIITDPPIGKKRRKNTFANHVKVSFPHGDLKN